MFFGFFLFVYNVSLRQTLVPVFKLIIIYITPMSDNEFTYMYMITYFPCIQTMLLHGQLSEKISTSCDFTLHETLYLQLPALKGKENLL